MNRLFLKMLIVALLPLTAAAKAPVQEAEVVRLSLQDCINYALRHSDTIKNARLAILKQDAANDQIKSNALPHLNGAVSVNAFPQPQQSLVPLSFFTQKQEDGNKYAPVQFTPTYNSTATLNGSQTLFDGSLLVALKARKTIMQAVTEASRLTEEGVRYNIQRAYYAVVIGQEQFKTLTASLATARDMMHDVEVLYQTGFAEKIDVSRSEVQLTNLETDSLRTASLLETGMQALKFTMGMEIDQPIELTDTSLNENINEATALLTETLDYARLTLVRLADYTIKLNEYNVKRYQLAAYPTLAATGTIGALYGSGTFSDVLTPKNYLNYSVVGLQLNIPIWNGFLRRSQVREAKVDLEMAQNRLHQLKQGIDFQTAQAQTMLRNALLAAKKQQRNLELANTVVDLSRKKFKAGVGSNLEVNQAQTDLLIAQNNYYNAQLDVINAQADVQKALGGFAQ